MCACVLSHVQLCDSTNCSLPGSSVRRILQARIVERVAMLFSRGSSWSRDWTWVSCIGRWILYHWTTWEAHKNKWDKHRGLSRVLQTLLHCAQSWLSSIQFLNYAQVPQEKKQKEKPAPNIHIDPRLKKVELKYRANSRIYSTFSITNNVKV